MKCIEATKPTKHVKAGTIKRVRDEEAELSVRDGYWKYVPKSKLKAVVQLEQKQENSQEPITVNKKSKK